MQNYEANDKFRSLIERPNNIKNIFFIDFVQPNESYLEVYLIKLINQFYYFNSIRI